MSISVVGVAVVGCTGRWERVRRGTCVRLIFAIDLPCPFIPAMRFINVLFMLKLKSRRARQADTTSYLTRSERPPPAVHLDGVTWMPVALSASGSLLRGDTYRFQGEAVARPMYEVRL
jgi:hypothetical protein